MEIYGAWKSDSWTASPEQILQVNVSFKRINQAASKRRAHADVRFFKRLQECIYCGAAAGLWRPTWKCLAIEYWLIAACKLIFVWVIYLFFLTFSDAVLLLDQFEILPWMSGFNYGSGKAWNSWRICCIPLGVQQMYVNVNNHTQNLSIYHLSIYWSIYLSIYLFIYLSVYLNAPHLGRTESTDVRGQWWKNGFTVCAAND